MNKSKTGIIDAVQAQNGQKWVCFGGPDGTIWFSIDELQRNEKDVFSRLATTGAAHLTSKSRNTVKEVIETYTKYRPGRVASEPGWTDGLFVMPNGDVKRPPGDNRPLIVAFAPLNKFTPRGDLETWHEQMSRVVPNQRIILFLIAYAFLGPLLRFLGELLPLNPQVEIVGPNSSGKTSAAVAAMSVFAGDPDGEAGGGENWDLTLQAIDEMKRDHCGLMLLLDESNLATSGRGLGLLQDAVFKLATARPRKRYNETQGHRSSRLAVLSTANELVTTGLRDEAKVGAIASRRVSIELSKDRQFGVLDSVPEGFDSAAAAMEHLFHGTRLAHGVAGANFIEKLVSADPQRVQVSLNRWSRMFLRHLRTIKGAPVRGRIPNTLACVFAAGTLAQRLGILPEEWGDLSRAVKTVFMMTTEGAGQKLCIDPAHELVAFVNRHKKALPPVASIRVPLSKSEFDSAPGFLEATSTGVRFTISTRKLSSIVKNPEKVLKDMRAKGRLLMEGGNQPKLSRKAPRKLCRTGRAYTFELIRGSDVSAH